MRAYLRVSVGCVCRGIDTGVAIGLTKRVVSVVRCIGTGAGKSTAISLLALLWVSECVCVCDFTCVRVRACV